MDSVVGGFRPDRWVGRLRAGLRGRWQSRVPVLAGYLMAALLAYLSANLAWVLVAVIFPEEQPGYSALPEVETARSGTEKGLGQVAWQELALFGIEPDPSAPPTVVKKVERQPKPKVIAEPLKLRLYGTVASTDPAKSLAVIAVKDGRPDIYKVGAELQAGVQLKEVRSWSILVSTGEAEQVVWLIEDSGRGSARRPPSVPEPGRPQVGETRISDPKVVAKLQDYRNDLGRDPMSLVDKINGTVVQRDGQPYGLRVRPGTDRPLLGQLGLRAGDILISLNGYSLSDITMLPLVVDQLKGQQDFQLDLERGGRRQEVHVILEDNYEAARSDPGEYQTDADGQDARSEGQTDDAGIVQPVDETMDPKEERSE